MVYASCMFRTPASSRLPCTPKSLPMKNTLWLLFVVALLGCTQSVAPVSGPPPVAPTDAAAPTDAVAPTDAAGPSAAEDAGVPTDLVGALIIDVRSQKEWDSGHLPQAIHIPHTEIAEKIGEHTDDKNTKIVLYCAVGGRAGKAQQKLQELGFVDVENAGGYDDIKKRFE